MTTNLIALAVAWSENRISFDACAASDNNRMFGLPPRSETRRDWVDDVQRRLAQAQEYLAIDTHDRLNFRPTLWTAAELAEHRTQGVPALSLFQPAFPSSRATSSTSRTSRPYDYKPALAMDAGLRGLAVVVERALSSRASPRCWAPSSSRCCTLSSLHPWLPDPVRSGGRSLRPHATRTYDGPPSYKELCERRNERGTKN